MDARSFSHKSKEKLRIKVIQAVSSGMSQSNAGKTFGIARGTVNRWVKSYKQGGMSAIKARRKGRPRRSGTVLKPCQMALSKHLIIHNAPDDIGLSAPLWNRKAVIQFIDQFWNQSISVPTAGHYIRNWGFVPLQADFHKYLKISGRPQKRISCFFSNVCEFAQEEDAKIHRMILGRTLKNAACADFSNRDMFDRFSSKEDVFIIATISDHKHLCFLVCLDGWTPEALIDFVRRLLVREPRKVFLILDSDSVTRSDLFLDWVSSLKKYLRVFFSHVTD